MSFSVMQEPRISHAKFALPAMRSVFANVHIQDKHVFKIGIANRTRRVVSTHMLQKGTHFHLLKSEKYTYIDMFG